MAYSLPIPDPSKPFQEQEQTILFAQAIFGEARSQEESARTGMGSTVRNRLIHWRPEYGLRTYAGVLLQEGAFDCFTDEIDQLMNPLKYEPEQVWESCYVLANGLMNGTIKDNVQRCTFYHSISLDEAGKLPYWAKPPVLGSKIEHVLDLGDLHFYRYLEIVQAIAENAWGG